MSTVIQVAGVALVLLLAAAMWQREWRLPILLFAFLAIPGNVDHLLPQMTLDPHQIADSTGPAISVIDLLVGWALILTLRERPLRRLTTPSRRLVVIAAALAVVASAGIGIHVAQGVEPAAGVRGVVLFVRLGVLLVLTSLLADVIADGTRLALGAAAGGVALIANGFYTTLTQGQERFTAATFGRNDFAVALLLVGILCIGLLLESASRTATVRRGLKLAVVGAVMAGVTVFGAMATGTRAALLALGVAAVVGLLVNRTWRSRRGFVAVAGVGVYLFVVIVASVGLTSAGGRTTSFLTNPGSTVAVIENLGDETTNAEVAIREKFWGYALTMIGQQPVLGVGPYQWNVQRYTVDPQSPVVTADAHDAYLQMAAEYGVPVLMLYGLLIAAAGFPIALAVWRGNMPVARMWTATTLACGGVAFLTADLTNSNLFNGRTGSAAWLIIGAAVCAAGPSTARLLAPASADGAVVLA